MHVYICLGPFIPHSQYSCLHLQSLYPFLRGILCARKYDFEHINKRFSRLCRKFPDLDFFVCFSFTRPYLTLCICCYTSNESQVVNIIHFGAIFSQLLTK